MSSIIHNPFHNSWDVPNDLDFFVFSLGISETWHKGERIKSIYIPQANARHRSLCTGDQIPCRNEKNEVLTGADSLNVSTAAAVVLFEASRQKQQHSESNRV